MIAVTASMTSVNGTLTTNSKANDPAIFKMQMNRFSGP